MILPNILDEVSGLTDIDSTHVACVQDEIGIVFIYNFHTEKMISQHTFDETGDFEGLTYTGKSLYILRSDGLLTEWLDFNIKFNKGRISNYKLKLLTSDNEGLCYDFLNNRLLIAAKNKPALKVNRNDRFIYEFNLSTKKLNKDPVYVLKLKTLKEYIKINNINMNLVNKKEKKNKFNFLPSGIAVHPMTQDIFIISASNFSIVVINQKGEVIQMIPLNIKQYPQAEGITFLRDGTMIITNESAGHQPTLLIHNLISINN